MSNQIGILYLTPTKKNPFFKENEWIGVHVHDDGALFCNDMQRFIKYMDAEYDFINYCTKLWNDNICNEFKIVANKYVSFEDLLSF